VTSVFFTSLADLPHGEVVDAEFELVEKEQPGGRLGKNISMPMEKKSGIRPLLFVLSWSKVYATESSQISTSINSANLRIV